MLEIFTQWSTMVTEAFGNDPRFLTSRDKAYRKLVNDTSLQSLQLRTGGYVLALIHLTADELRAQCLHNAII